MSTAFVFPTSDAVTAEHVNNFINKSFTFPQPTGAAWCLIPSASSPTPETKETNPPVQPFKTGFRDVSGQELGAHVLNRLPKRTADAGMLTNSTFAVLDGRSVKDETVVMWSWFAEYDELKGEEVNGRWEPWRVFWAGACHALVQLEDNQELFETKKDDPEFWKGDVFLVSKVS